MFRKFIALSVFMVVLMSSCRGNGEGTRIAEPLDSLFSEIFPADGPAGVVAVAKDDPVIYLRAFGMQDLDENIKATPNTRFNICSISKQFSAIALLKLQEQRLLNLNDSLAAFFPEFTAPLFKPITLRHLLSHTSGLPDIRPRTQEQWVAYTPEAHRRFTDLRDYMLHSSEPDAIDMFRTVDSLLFEPGTAFDYQNPTFQLVYYIVERVTGVPFKVWMQQNVFGPARMSHTSYISPDEEIPNAAHGYEVNDGIWEEKDYGEARFFVTAADGGIYTTAGDFLNWHKALYGDEIVSAESRRQAHTPIIEADDPDSSYGLGFYISEREGSPRKIYHTGDNGGFYSYACAVPEKGVSYLVFGAHQNWDRLATAQKIDSILTAHRIL